MGTEDLAFRKHSIALDAAQACVCAAIEVLFTLVTQSNGAPLSIQIIYGAPAVLLVGYALVLLRRRRFLTT